jgi:hypothetical protein
LLRSERPRALRSALYLVPALAFNVVHGFASGRSVAGSFAVLLALYERLRVAEERGALPLHQPSRVPDFESGPDAGIAIAASKARRMRDSTPLTEAALAQHLRAANGDADADLAAAPPATSGSLQPIRTLTLESIAQVLRAVLQECEPNVAAFPAWSARLFCALAFCACNADSLSAKRFASRLESSQQPIASYWPAEVQLVLAVSVTEDLARIVARCAQVRGCEVQAHMGEPRRDPRVLFAAPLNLLCAALEALESAALQELRPSLLMLTSQFRALAQSQRAPAQLVRDAAADLIPPVARHQPHSQRH